MPKTPQIDFSTILANSVHDMKNSVNMLLCALDEIDDRRGQDPAASNDAISQLRYEGKRLNSNLIQVLTLYRVSEQQYSLNITENDVAELLEECLLDNEGLLALKGIDIETDCADDLVCFFDRELVASIINSVINNAYKYARTKIRLGAKSEDGYTALYVEEDGNGYPEFMVHEDRGVQHQINLKNGSTGLGLLFTSTIARMHSHQDRQGFITTTNDGIDGGGRFTLYLP